MRSEGRLVIERGVFHRTAAFVVAGTFGIASVASSYFSPHDAPLFLFALIWFSGGPLLAAALKTRLVVDGKWLTKATALGPITLGELHVERGAIRNIVRATSDRVRHDGRPAGTFVELAAIMKNGDRIPLMGGLGEDDALAAEETIEEALAIVDEPALNTRRRDVLPEPDIGSS